MPGLVAPDWVYSWVYEFGLMVLPVFSAGFIALFAIHDLHRRVARCQEMRVRLETARKEAGLVQTWGALERVVMKAERALLQEVFEWHSITSFAVSSGKNLR
jgi:N-methylhydantoinase B/oxoprolinase/acetone carboxylase alpha subunit